MKRILLAGFKGEHNSARVILDKCAAPADKLYLENDFLACAAQIRGAVADRYDFILILGQKPVIKAVYIETAGRGPQVEILSTGFDYGDMAKYITTAGFRVRVSGNAGNYLCNHVFFNALTAARDAGRQTQVAFLHIPMLKNLTDADKLAQTLAGFLSGSKKGIPFSIPEDLPACYHPKTDIAP